MAAASVSARPPSTTPRPNGPSIHTTTATSTSPSPSLSSKRPPSASHPSAQLNGTTAPSTAPRHALRRRESQRGSVARNNKGSFMEVKKTLNEPYVRTTEHILHKFRGNRPSLILHLHPTHFRFEQQDGSFGYNSPMKAILEHLKAQTIPHEFLEELLHANVPFYDGCLIVEVHDHKSALAANRNFASDTAGDNSSTPFSIHNYKEWLTPSPHVAYPSQAQTNGAAQKIKEAAANGSDKTKEQSASVAPKKSSPVFTTVLFPTPLARHKELMLLATTPVPDQRGGRRQSSMSARDSANANTANPPTPLSSIPTTPGGSRGPPSKRRMILEEKDIHSFEGDVLRATEPPLFLEPAESFDEVLLAMKTLKDPLHSYTPSMSQARKRTTAELAADEEQAAEDERMALLMDGRLQPSHSAPGAGANASTADGHNAAKDFDPNFARFKALEDIKRRLDEENRRKKEEDMQQQQKKKEQQEAEVQQRMREAEEARGQQQQQQQQIQMMRQRQAAMQQQANMRGGGQLPPHMMQNPHLQQVSQGQHSSPVMRNHTPQNSSPLSANVINNNPQAGIPHSASMSSQIQGPGSPPRPGSAMQGHPAMANPMARQVSQQHSQTSQSRAGTPQMGTSTPHMGQSMPAGHMTPQPGLNQGSPVSNGALTTPMMPQSMPNNPQMNGAQMPQTPQNPQQAAQMIARRNQLIAQQQRAAQMQGQGSAPNTGQFANQQMSPQQLQMLQMQQQRNQQQNGQFSHSMQQMMQNMPQGLTPQQQQSFRMQQEQRQRIAMQQQANMQNQNQNVQQPQGTPGQSMPNGISMTPSVSQGSAQSPFMPQQMNQMQQQGQGNAQMNPQQNAQLAAQQQQQRAQQQQQAMLQQQMYYKNLRDRNNGILPQNAQDLWNQFRTQRAMAAGQGQMPPGHGPPPGSAGGQQVPGMMNAQQFQQTQQQMANMQRQRQQMMIQQQQQQQRNQMQQQQSQQGRPG